MMKPPATSKWTHRRPPSQAETERADQRALAGSCDDPRLSLSKTKLRYFQFGCPRNLITSPLGPKIKLRRGPGWNVALWYVCQEGEKSTDEQ